jgi:hypothetical protein
MATLVYLGGASLTFGSAEGRRVVKRGEPFEVSAELAKVLLADPSVSTPEEVGTMFEPEAVASPQARLHSTSGLTAIKALRTRAKELGIPTTGKAAELTAAITAAEKRPASPFLRRKDQPTEADVQPAPGPGAITLGDLPPSAKIGGS